MLEDILVSIIVPVYNIESYIGECIESIQNQSYKNIEIILVDDGSVDNSGLICDRYSQKDERIRVIHKKNEGVTIARKTGVKVSLGNLVMFVDGDDWIDKEIVEMLVDKENESKADLIVCGHKWVEGSNKKLVLPQYEVGYYSKKEMETSVYPTMLMMENCIENLTLHSLCCKLYKKDLLENTFENIDEKIVVCEDAVAVLSYVKQCDSLFVVHNCLYNYRYRQGSAMHKYMEGLFDNLVRLEQAMKDIFFDIENGKIQHGYYIFYQLSRCIKQEFQYSNNKNRGERIHYIKKYIELPQISEIIRAVDLNNLNRASKIVGFFLKHHLYCLMAWVLNFVYWIKKNKIK